MVGKGRDSIGGRDTKQNARSKKSGRSSCIDGRVIRSCDPTEVDIEDGPPPEQEALTVIGNGFSVADSFIGVTHSGTHFHAADPDTTLPPGNPPIGAFIDWMEVGGFFGDEECRGLAQFRLAEIDGSLTTATVQVRVADLFAYGYSPEADGIDGLFGQDGPASGTFTVEAYDANGTEETDDYEATSLGTLGTIDPTTITADDILSFDVKDELQTQLDASATHLGIRIRQTTRDMDEGAATFIEPKLIINGGSANYTTFDGTGDYFHIDGGFLTSGALTTLSGACWVRVQSGWSTSALFGESGTTGDFGWFFYISNTGQILLMASDDGVARQWQSAAGEVTADAWIHLAFTYNAGTVTVYKDGATVTQQSNSTAASITRTSEFAIGAVQTDGTPATLATVDLARIAIEKVEWSSATVTDIMNGTVPATAWYFPYGDNYESQQYVQPLHKAGDPTTFGTGAFTLTPAPPPVAPTTIWEFLSGDITEGDWNTYRAALDTGSEGRPVGETGGETHDMGAGELIFAPTPHEVAEYAAGDLRCERYVPAQNHHTLLAADGEALDAAFEDFYLVKETDYVITCQWTLGGNSEADWRDSSKLTFGLLWEMWQPKTGPTWATWAGGGQAPIQIMVNNTGTGDNELLLYLRGSTDDNTYTTTTVVPLATTLVATHKVELRFRLSKTVTTAWSVFHNDVFKGSGQQEIGVDRSPGGSYSAGDASPQIGLYVGSSSIAGYWADVERHTIAKV